jgi:hypothetical protein
VIATHGRSLYVIDDLIPIRDAGRAMASSSVYLYSPTDPVRRVTDAGFYYYLRRPADTVKIDILDSKGAVIRSYVGTKTDTARARADSLARDSAKTARADAVIRRESIGAPTGCDTQQQPQNPKTSKGLNRFAWNLRYKGATTFDCMILWSGNANGPLAPPGQYKVRVTANGETQTQSFVLRRDPRLIGVSDADLRAQFALARDINTTVAQANDAVIRIRVIRDQLQKRIGAAPSPSLAQETSLVLRQLGTIEESLYQTRNRSGQDPLNFPIRLNNRLAALQRSVETGDARPTTAAYTVFNELSADLDRQLSLLDQVLKTDLPKVNAVLKAASQPPVMDK